MSFKTILHPTDFSEQSMVAFSHALKLAIEEKARFIIMYVQVHTLVQELKKAACQNPE